MAEKYHKEVSVKNKWIALVLAIFLGWLGVHRFYVGKVGTGIIYFFTVGVAGIGIIIDIIMILTGSFTDKGGKFLK
ncbi:TM2 domain-containing protein [Candidatus Woesearchaeota archaeon]|nr:TM2 domain-containing protein [Candidatus Woesearchaeota archaeon]